MGITRLHYIQYVFVTHKLCNNFQLFFFVINPFLL